MEVKHISWWIVCLARIGYLLSLPYAVVNITTTQFTIYNDNKQSKLFKQQQKEGE